VFNVILLISFVLEYMNPSTYVADLKTLDSSKIEGFLSSFSSVEKSAVLKLVAAEKEGPGGIYGISANNVLQGIISWELLEWDTHFFKKPMARISFFLLNTKALSLDISAKLLSFLLDKAKENKIVHIDVRVNTDNLFYSWALQKSGFITVDIRANFELSLEGRSTNSKDKRGDCAIRFARGSDLSQLQEICAESFILSRFCVDPFFTKEETEDFHQAWVENIINDSSNVILVAEHNSEIIGFIACHLNNGCGVIDLITTKNGFREKGIGTRLISELMDCIKDKADSLKVSTQIYNYAAVNLYAKSGFNLKKTEISYSKEI